MALLIEKPWRTQPTGPVTVDWNSPFAQWLAFFIAPIGGTLQEVVRAAGTASNSSTRRATTDGMAADYANQQSTFSHNAKYDILGPITLITCVDVDTLTNYGAIISKNSGTTTNLPYELRIGDGATDSQIGFVRANSNYRAFRASTSNTLSAGSQRNIVAVTQTANIQNSPIFYVNGTTYSGVVSGTAPGGTGSGAPTSNSGLLYIGKRGDGVTYLDGAIRWVVGFSRILSANEIAVFSANPYQIFRPLELQISSPPPPRIYYVAGPNATWATPTSTEIINGQLSGGGAATAAWNESAPLTTTTPFNFSQPASPLTTGTKYRAAAVQKAADSNVVSNVVVSDPFLAGAATLSNPEATAITDTTTKPKVDVAY